MIPTFCLLKKYKRYKKCTAIYSDHQIHPYHHNFVQSATKNVQPFQVGRRRSYDRLNPQLNIQDIWHELA